MFGSLLSESERNGPNKSVLIGLALVVGLVGLVVGSLGAAGAAPAAQPVGSVGTGTGPPFVVDGPWVGDQYGRALLLRGVNLVRKVPPYIMPDVPGGLDAEVAKGIADLGFDTVRLGVTFDGLMPTRGHIDEGYIDKVEREIEMEGAAGQVSAAKHDAGAKRAPSASLAATGFDSQAPTAAGVLAFAVLLRAVFARMRRGGER
jgi:hypothetical protein